jgi:hypothetical protein
VKLVPLKKKPWIYLRGVWANLVSGFKGDQERRMESYHCGGGGVGSRRYPTTAAFA